MSIQLIPYFLFSVDQTASQALEMLLHISFESVLPYIFIFQSVDYASHSVSKSVRRPRIHRITRFASQEISSTGLVFDHQVDVHSLVVVVCYT